MLYIVNYQNGTRFPATEIGKKAARTSSHLGLVRVRDKEELRRLDAKLDAMRLRAKSESEPEEGELSVDQVGEDAALGGWDDEDIVADDGTYGNEVGFDDADDDDVERTEIYIVDDDDIVSETSVDSIPGEDSPHAQFIAEINSIRGKKELHKMVEDRYGVNLDRRRKLSELKKEAAEIAQMAIQAEAENS